VNDVASLVGSPDPSRSVNEAMLPKAEPGHVLGPVADDWEAAEVWLTTIRLKSKNGSNETEKTYRYHLAKLRWYCEHVGRVTPSRWSVQDVQHFIAFLTDLPADAIRLKNVSADHPEWTPFTCQPSTSSQADIRRCVHALFAKWHAAGYIRINPMALIGAGNVRRVDTQRSVSIDLFDQVLAIMEEAEKNTYTDRQTYVRDVFILEALRGMGLRSSELVGATMSAFSQVTVVKTGKRYWIFTVSESTGKGGKTRPVPVPVAVWDALTKYRTAFGVPAQPVAGDTTRLILSPRTQDVSINKKAVKHTGTRRFFRAWREVATRQGLYLIVTGRFEQAAQLLAARGDANGAEQLRRASTHWLRHSFGKASLLSGHSMRGVAGALGHADMSTTMIYTEQDAQDLIEAWELANPGSVAGEENLT
jgi:site-specific recombinase XerD